MPIDANELVPSIFALLSGPIWPTGIPSSAESAAGIVPSNFFYSPYDIRRYGADPTGTVASDVALTSAIAVCGAFGGVIRAPAGNYTFANPINLNVKVSITIQGDSVATAGGQPATRFTYTGTGTGTWITMQSANGCKITGIQLYSNQATFTGTHISNNNDGTHGDPVNCGVTNCTFNAASAGVTHLNLDKCITFTADTCQFSQGNPSIQGQAHAGGSYSNVITFKNCTWTNNAVAPIQDLGQAWSFIGCTFEGLNSGAPGALTTNGTTTFSSGLLVTGCWFGDTTTTAGVWINGFHNGATFTGNYISGNQTGSTAFSLQSPSGIVISGNTLQGLLTALNFQTGAGHAVIFTGNFISSVTNIITNPANMDLELVFNPNSPMVSPPTGKGAFNSNGYEVSPNGMVRMWGTATVTTSTPLAVGFAAVAGIAFPNNVFNIQMSFGSTPGANVAAATSISAAGFTINVAGTAGSNTVYWQALGN